MFRVATGFLRKGGGRDAIISSVVSPALLAGIRIAHSRFARPLTYGLSRASPSLRPSRIERRHFPARHTSLRSKLRSDYGIDPISARAVGCVPLYCVYISFCKAVLYHAYVSRPVTGHSGRDSGAEAMAGDGTRDAPRRPGRLVACGPRAADPAPPRGRTACLSAECFHTVRSCTSSP